MNIVGNRKIFYLFSGALFAASIVSLLIWGLRFGIDFTGGSIMEIEYAGERPAQDDIARTLEAANLGSVTVQPTGERGVLLRFRHSTEEEHQHVLGLLGAGGASVAEKRFDTIGPTIGNELKRRSVSALVLVLGLITFYIAWAFRKVSKPVESWKYGIVAVIALFHDVIIPVGIFSVLGHFAGAEVDTLFVTAILTILGFSVHDTIVVFDRIRESLRNAKQTSVFEAIAEKSVHETIARSINTSVSVLLSLFAIYLFGGSTVKYFSLTMIFGVIFGIYSSIFIASPLLVSWHEWSRTRGGK